MKRKRAKMSHAQLLQKRIKDAQYKRKQRERWSKEDSQNKKMRGEIQFTVRNLESQMEHSNASTWNHSSFTRILAKYNQERHDRRRLDPETLACFNKTKSMKDRLSRVANPTDRFWLCLLQPWYPCDCCNTRVQKSGLYRMKPSSNLHRIHGISKTGATTSIL